MGCVEHQLYGLGVEVCKAASCPSTDPKHVAAVSFAFICLNWFVSSELQLLAVTRIQSSASEYLQLQTCLSCCQYPEILIYTWCRQRYVFPWLPAVSCKSAQLLLMTWRL